MKFPRVMLLALAATAMLSGCGKTAAPTTVAPSFDTTPPPVPENVAVTVDPTGAQSLTWAASSASDLAGYQVYFYSPDPTRDNSFVLINETSATTNSYTLPPVNHFTTYFYRVRAVDQAGNHSGLTPTYSANLRPIAPAGGSTTPSSYQITP